MTQGERSTAGWWANAPADRVVRLEGATAELLHLSLDPLPAGAPAVIGCRPAGLDRLAEQVQALLADLEQAAAGLLPLWLPGAGAIAGPQGAGVAAVRALARERAAGSAHFGPFLADLAERSLRRRAPSPEPLPRNGFPAAVRAEGLSRVIADSYRRGTAALLIEIPEGLTVAQEHAVVASAEWLAHHGTWAVWLTGAPLRDVDRIDRHRIQLPSHLADLAGAVEVPVRPQSPSQPRNPALNTASDTSPNPSSNSASNSHPPAVAAVRCPAVTGLPRADSPAELKLESALSTRSWAAGRAWNITYQPEPLAPSCRLDLWWAAEHCVVEVDGPEHHNAVHYAADRSRDVRLQLAGNTVLRFTNDQVLDDVHMVVSQIERLIRSRRPQVLEDQTHAH
ncbi:MAG TPA: DUF559 domain-containing protein [Actinocrinis sp.]|nr:DUF559 domain-containing protein [Actinocrinis sp.]